ncbi:MAG: type II toxin-antitoxin system VapC family toxin [Proteobacteria bacterium]|nr:type II toxin-antitoxin system VapC family toxin [Pseudomonadota bacterium]MBS0463727.1 type II toxin-antitoxin system VapC family toxin [Pseudomonadota bacterium]
MIHFDTNALVYLPQWAKEVHPIIERIVAGESAAVCSVVWYEYLRGPLAKEEAALAHAFVQGRILAVTEADAQLAAALFNTTGRKRTHRTDTLIAACAIRAGAEFVTANAVDFRPLTAHGLRLVGV